VAGAKRKRDVNGTAKSNPPKVKKSKKAKSDETEEHEDAVEEVDDQTRALVKALDSDSEDELRGEETFVEGQDVGDAPVKAVKKSKKKLQSSEKEEPGVIYLGGIPHGFYEHQMRQYFSQFGEITKLRLSRNKRTGASKHYAFIEFAEESTAEIVAKSMSSQRIGPHLAHADLPF
jgi:nucleolar protein 15